MKEISKKATEEETIKKILSPHKDGTITNKAKDLAIKKNMDPKYIVLPTDLNNANNN